MSYKRPSKSSPAPAYRKDTESGRRADSKTKAVKRKIGKYPSGNKEKSFMKRLDKHKEIGNSFDNGTWKPRYKGQSFIQALEEHKEHDRGEFI